VRTNSITLVALVAIISLAGSVVVIGATQDNDDRPCIYTTMSWQQEMVEEIVGDSYIVKSFLLPNSDPHSTALTPGSIASSNTVVYFAIGSGVEWELENLSVIKEELDIPTYECCEDLIGWGIDLLPGECHHHGHDHSDHEHGSYDPHVWTSPERLKLIAEYVRDVMMELDPDNAEIFAEGCEGYTKKTDILANLASSVFENKAAGEIVVWHSSWAYLLPDDISEVPILKTAQSLTTPSQMMNLKKGTADEPLVVFLSNEREIKGMTEKELNDSGVYVRIVVINVLAQNWLDELEKAINVFGDELSETIQ
jgi:zinc transport system substrate-binding protein